MVKASPVPDPLPEAIPGDEQALACQPPPDYNGNQQPEEGGGGGEETPEEKQRKKQQEEDEKRMKKEKEREQKDAERAKADEERARKESNQKPPPPGNNQGGGGGGGGTAASCGTVRRLRHGRHCSVALRRVRGCEVLLGMCCFSRVSGVRSSTSSACGSVVGSGCFCSLELCRARK